MVYQRWYLSTWFIALMFAFTYYVVPFIIGAGLLLWKYLDKKKKVEEMEESGFFDLAKLQENKEKLKIELDRMNNEKESLSRKISKDKAVIEEKKFEIIYLDNEILYQSFGFYEPKYGFENVEGYKKKLVELRDKQKQMVKNNNAADYRQMTLDGSKKKGEMLTKDNIKMAIRAFNQECDTAIAKAKFNNIDSIEKQINKAHTQLNKLNKRNGIEIKKSYLSLKIDELYLAYEYQVKKEEEKEEQRRIKEQMKEEKRIQQEIEREKKKLEKDEKHFENALVDYQVQLAAADDEMKLEIEKKMAEIGEKMKEIQEEKQAVDYREQNAKAGYVYVISNIGSFGEDVFKIGMTRRLEPLERVNELGNASVPFGFDVHAMIFADDAPKLENSLHRAFIEHQVNRVNARKEFFNVSLDEIVKVVKENHNKTVEFTKLAEAEEFRKSQQLIKESEQIGA